MLFKVTSKVSGWVGQIGEFVRDEGEKVVLRMPAGRLVEFDPKHVEAHVPAEPETADAKTAPEQATK